MSPPVVCLDLDGVIWRGDAPIPSAAGAVELLRTAGLRIGFLSNNSSMVVADVVAKLDHAGVAADPAEVLTSAVSAGALLGSSLPAGARVLVCAGPGVVEALTNVGLTLVREPPAAAVVVGFHRDFDYDELERASRAIREGARFVATNLDSTYPTADGMIPGTGALVATVATASSAIPEVTGKPEPPTVALVHQRLGTTGVMVGARPSTDGAMADTLGWPFALVLSGVTAAVAPPGGEAIPSPPPPYVAADIGGLAPGLVAALT